MTHQDAIREDSRYTALYDHGFVGLIETMGSDTAIAAAARVSYGEGTKSVSDDWNLIRYLIRNHHTGPLEMAEVKFHIKCPIFVMRQLVRHRSASINEYSARYSVLSDEFYIPADDYLAPQSTTNKQGRASGFPMEFTPSIRAMIKHVLEVASTCYTALLGVKTDLQKIPSEFVDVLNDQTYPGLSRELARIIMPVANYTECYWKIDLHNFFHFACLRMDAYGAQQEIRDFASAMYQLAKLHFPIAAQAFEDYILNGASLSAMDLTALKDMLSGTFRTDAAYYGMSKREFTEFNTRFVPTDTHSAALKSTVA